MMEPLRCSRCKALLAMCAIVEGEIQIKCRNCNTMVRLTANRLTTAATPT